MLSEIDGAICNLAANLNSNGIWLNKRESDKPGNWRESVVSRTEKTGRPFSTF